MSRTWILVTEASSGRTAAQPSGPGGMAAAVLHSSQPAEPISLLVSGTALIGLAGAVRRLTF